MMTCRELTEFLGEYRSGELDSPTRQRFEAHLRRCIRCVEYLSSYEETIRLARLAAAEPDTAPPDSVPEELVSAILASREAGPAPAPPRRARGRK